MTIEPKASSLKERVIAKARVTEQIDPLDDFHHAAELTAEVLNAAASIRCGTPAVRVDFQLPHDVRDDVAVENAVVSYTDTAVAEVLDLAVFQARYVFAYLIHRGIALFVVFASRLL